MKQRIILRLTLFLLFTLLVNFLTFAQENRKDRIQQVRPYFALIDSLFKAHAEKNNFPGFAYGLIVDDSLVFAGSTGFSHLEQKIPAGKESVFRIASMSKSFTAMAILKLKEEGKLQLDDPVYKYIPEIRNSRLNTVDAPDITIRHLLTHAGGFPEDNPWGDRQLDESDENLRKMIGRGISFSTTPGTAYEYSNLGFALLGSIIQLVSGMPYSEYIRSGILTPLGMNSTWFEYTDVPAKRLALGYRNENGRWVSQPLLHDGIYGAMGGMLSTVEDFSRYIRFHLSAWPPSDKKESGPVKRSHVREMHHPWNIPAVNMNFSFDGKNVCPAVGAYGYGLRWVKDCKGRVFVGHSGGLPGYGSNWQIMPDYGIGIVSFSNMTYASTTGINMAVLDALLTASRLSPRIPEVSPVLQLRKTELLRFLPDWNGAEKSGIFAENFFLDNFTNRLRNDCRNLFQKAGKIKKVHDLIPENNLRGAFLIEGEMATLRVYFTLSPEQNPLIQEFRIMEIKP